MNWKINITPVILLFLFSSLRCNTLGPDSVSSRSVIPVAVTENNLRVAFRPFYSDKPPLKTGILMSFYLNQQLSQECNHLNIEYRRAESDIFLFVHGAEYIEGLQDDIHTYPPNYAYTYIDLFDEITAGNYRIKIVNRGITDIYELEISDPYIVIRKGEARFTYTSGRDLTRVFVRRIPDSFMIEFSSPDSLSHLYPDLIVQMRSDHTIGEYENPPLNLDENFYIYYPYRKHRIPRRDFYRRQYYRYYSPVDSSKMADTVRRFLINQSISSADHAHIAIEFCTGEVIDSN